MIVLFSPSVTLETDPFIVASTDIILRQCSFSKPSSVSFFSKFEPEKFCE